MLIRSLLLSSMILLATSYASANKEVGNGGDICENRIKTIRDDIDTWILRGGPAGLKLPEGLDQERYKAQMRGAIHQATISCTDAPVYIGTAQKTCTNFMDSNGRQHILCDNRRFLETTQENQYVLVHHEYAGLAGFEVNTQESSHYFISNQISGFLEEQTVKKLAVLPTEKPFKSSRRTKIEYREEERVLDKKLLSLDRQCQWRKGVKFLPLNPFDIAGSRYMTIYASFNYKALYRFQTYTVRKITSKSFFGKIRITEEIVPGSYSPVLERITVRTQETEDRNGDTAVRSCEKIRSEAASGKCGPGCLF